MHAYISTLALSTPNGLLQSKTKRANLRLLSHVHDFAGNTEFILLDRLEASHVM